ncbi:MAG TPA: POTRA domain-containing protein, partial [Candidatus Nitrosotenuis sp.]|nr:POTRA domain-containing protein [Candidatus Nitrosotenuis sp.]
YHERGFLRAKVGAPQARFTGNPNLPMPDKITVVVPISPGVAYRLKSVDWSGNLALGAAALNEITGLKIGEPANGLHIFRAWERVRSEYGRIGHIQMTLEASPQFDDANAAVSYRVKIEEGPQFRMGRLIITGLSVTAERKLYAAWSIQPGDIFNAQYFEEFLENDARKKRAFGDYVVHYTKVGHLLRPNPQTRTVDVLLDFQ